MSFSAYVDSYPITAYIVGHLGLSVSDFCRRYEFDPTIVSGWQTANRSVFSLPADFCGMPGYYVRQNSGSSPLHFTLVRKATFRLSLRRVQLGT